MTKPILHLFPDTNLFVQCRPLHELDWSELGDFSEIHLIVCRPVQREIDNQKNRGNDRVAQRARRTYPLFRKIIIGETGYELVNDDPPVKIFIESSSLPDEELSNTLDYGKPDDEVVGCCSQYWRKNPCLDVRLLTHDTGPMMSAKTVGLPFIPINDDWLIPPEHNKSEREIARLESELSKLKRAEPAFQVGYLNEQGMEITSLECTYKVYEPLNFSEISDLVEILEERFPIAREFNRHGPKPYDPFRRYKLVPPTQASILKYESEDYPRWLDACESFLQNLHEALQQRELLHFTFTAKNSGIQPAQDALVVVCAKGNFKIQPPEYIDENEEGESESELYLPEPPRAPRSKWIERPLTLSDLTAYNSLTISNNKLFEMPDVSLLSSNRRRDPNMFYYKPHRYEVPVECFSLECEQWRHAIPAEWFQGIVVVPEGETQIKGALEFSIHAKNLSEPTRKLIPVKIDVEQVSTTTFAQQLVDEMRSTSFRSV